METIVANIHNGGICQHFKQLCEPGWVSIVIFYVRPVHAQLDLSIFFLPQAPSQALAGSGRPALTSSVLGTVS